jgi:hypothetical protein
MHCLKCAVAPIRQQFFQNKKNYLNLKLNYYPQSNKKLTKKKVKDPNTPNLNEVNFLDPRVYM